MRKIVTTNDQNEFPRNSKYSQDSLLREQVISEIKRLTATYVNVKDFGAVGDGVADDTTAINSAIASLPERGGSVFFPAGTYLHTDDIKARNALWLFGEGSSSTVLYQVEPSKNGISGVDVLTLKISGIKLAGPTGGTGTGILLTRKNNNATNYLHLSDVHIRTFGQDGIYVSNGIVSRFDSVVSSYNGRHGFFFQGLDGVIGTSTTLSNCFADDNGASGYMIDTMGYMALVACAADHNTVGYTLQNAIGVTVTGSGAENNGDGWIISGGYGNVITGGWVYTNNGVGVHIKDNSIGASILGLSETSPAATATAFVKVDAGSKATVMNVHNTTANSFAPGTTQIINDVVGNSAFNGSLDVQGELLVNGVKVNTMRGSRWYIQGTETPDYSNVQNPIEGDIFLYTNSKDLFRFNGTEWTYAGSIA